MNDLALVDVEWEDDYYESDYKTFDEWEEYIASNPVVCHNVGYLLYDTSERIGLVNNVDENGAMSVVVIPKGTVRSVRYLAVRYE